MPTDWARITQRRFHSMHLDTPAFTGYRTLPLRDAVSEPFWTHLEAQPCCVADSVFAWLPPFPTGAPHTVTTMFDQDGRVVQWYIDVCSAHGTDKRGIPRFDDLYLYIVVSPSGTHWLLDADELEAALRTGLISRADHDMAQTEARRLLVLISLRQWSPLELSEAHLAAHTAVLTASGHRHPIAPKNSRCPRSLTETV